jgi:hypothetical protein
MSHISDFYINENNVWRKDPDEIRAALGLGMQREWYIQQNANQTSLATVGINVSPTQNGTASVHSAVDGQYIQYASSALLPPRHAGWTNSSFNLVRADYGPIVYMRFKTGPVLADIQSCRIWAGLFSADPVGLDSPVAIQLAAFRYATAVDGTAFWRMVTGDGVTLNTQVSALSVAADTFYNLRLDFSELGECKFYNETTYLGSSSVNLPNAALNLSYVVNLTTVGGVGVSKTFRVSRVYVNHTR